MTAKHLLQVKSCTSESKSCIGHGCSIVAAVAGRKLMAHLNSTLKPVMGTNNGAACRSASRLGVSIPCSTSFAMYALRKALSGAS